MSSMVWIRSGEACGFRLAWAAVSVSSKLWPVAYGYVWIDLRGRGMPMNEQSRIAPTKAATHKLQGYRYYDRDFAAREWEAVWAKSWLLICRQDAIPEEGDFIVEEV